MATSVDVHVRICGQEIIKYDLEIKALIQVRTENVCLLIYVFFAHVGIGFIPEKCLCMCHTTGLKVGQTNEANVNFAR